MYQKPSEWRCAIKLVYPARNGYALVHLYHSPNQGYVMYLGEYLTRDQAIDLAKDIGILPECVDAEVTGCINKTGNEPVYNITKFPSGKVFVRNPSVSQHWILWYDPEYAIKVTK